ncbi:hypothetical protein G6F40_015482 [Rhizopus arrhizus]|nr:hypothetical protein G6F40_015482 [Rhizopus arrhizus]
MRSRPAGAPAPADARRADRGGAGPAWQRYAQDDGQRRRDRKLQDLSPRGHVPDRRTRGTHPIRLAQRRAAPGDGVAPPAVDDPHVAQRHGRRRHARCRRGGPACRGGRHAGRVGAGRVRPGRHSRAMPERRGGGRGRTGAGRAGGYRDGAGHLGGA